MDLQVDKTVSIVESEFRHGLPDAEALIAGLKARPVFPTKGL